jgi:hypothetical protein
VAILFQRSNAVFQPGTNAFPFSVDATITQITITLEHGDWPEGDCFTLWIDWGSEQTGVFACGGGLVRDKTGTPTGGTTVVGWTCNKPPGITTGIAHLDVLQRLRTAVLIEGF